MRFARAPSRAPLCIYSLLPLHRPVVPSPLSHQGDRRLMSSRSFIFFFSPIRNHSVPRLIIIDFSLRINIPERNLAFGMLVKDRLGIVFDHLERNFFVDGYVTLHIDRLIWRNISCKHLTCSCVLRRNF